jgi:hypothetical protein
MGMIRTNCTRALFLLWLLFAWPSLLAWNSQSTPQSKLPVPTVAFSFEFPGGQPSNYAISVRATGETEYHSKPEDSTGDPDVINFKMSEATRAQIFDLTQHAHYFKGSFEYKGKVAQTGTKTLSYDDDARHFTTSYNYSINPTIQQLTEIFQDIAETMGYDHSLRDVYQHQKLGLEEVLKNMEDEAKDGRLKEVQALSPILKQIADDRSVMNIARARAQRLLQSSGEQVQTSR